jgi:hypothetical protein
MEVRDMSILKTLIVAAGLAAATGALAGPTRLSDSQYLAAARCDGLYTSPALGKVDASAINQVMKSEGSARDAAVLDRADQVRDDAKREARNASPTSRAALVAERDGACQTLASAGQSGAQAAR